MTPEELKKQEEAAAAAAEASSKPVEQKPVDQAALLSAALQQALQPLQASIASLQQQQQQLGIDQARKLEADKKAQLDKQSSLSELLADLDEEEVVTTEDKLEKMSKRQLVDVLVNATETAIAANNERVKAELGTGSKAIEEKLGGLEKALMTIVARMGVDQARKQFTDFDQHTEAVAAVMAKYPGMDFQDAYVLAKGLKAGQTPPAKVAETEKPDNFVTAMQPRREAAVGEDAYAIVAARGKANRSQSAGVPTGGLAGFREILRDAIDKKYGSD